MLVSGQEEQGGISERRRSDSQRRRIPRGPVRLAVALFLFAVSPAMSVAANYYFSNCLGPGGDGTLANPWCLIPTGQTTRKSVALLTDGTNSGASNPEFAPGDTAYLCSGACDGSGTGVFNVASTASGTWIQPRVSGTASSRITIAPYCNGSACETVVISGDTNANGVYDSGTDVVSFVSNSLGSKNYYTIDGDPSGTGAKHIVFEKTGGIMFEFSNAQPGIRNWTWNGLEIRNNDPVIWNGGALGTVCPRNDQGFYVFHLDYMDGGPVTISNNKIHDICLITIRANNNYAAGNELIVENNEWYNTGAIDDNNNFTGQNSGAKQTFRGNYAHDTRTGIFVGNNLQHVLIENNTMACLGQYDVEPNLGCVSGIFVNDGDSPQCTTNCWADDIVIRGNKVYGTSASPTPPFGQSCLGCMNGGILWSANYNQGGATAYPTRAIIENNMVWWTHPHYDGIDCSTFQTFGKGGIAVLSKTSGLVVQNNTVYDSTYPFLMCGAGGSPVFTLRNNLIVRGERPPGSHNPELYVASDAVASVIEYNDIHPAGLSGNVVTLGGTGYACSAINTFNNGSTRKGNICQPATFTAVSGAKGSWDLRLSGSQAAIDGGCGGVGARFLCTDQTKLVTTDIEGQARFAGLSPDIGADELGTVSVNPTASLTLSPTPPASGGNAVLRAGSWTLTMATSTQVVNPLPLLTLTDAQGHVFTIVLSGAIPGASFTGTLVINTSVSDGVASFTLPIDALVDALGNKGNVISIGGTLAIDQTPPQRPSSVVVQ